MMQAFLAPRPWPDGQATEASCRRLLAVVSAHTCQPAELLPRRAQPPLLQLLLVHWIKPKLKQEMH